MDCFYAAVEVKYRPELKGKALGIGGPAYSRSVLCTASYEARKYGVRSAMPSSQAVRLCPHLILLPPRFELYKKESAKVREIFLRFTDKIEPLSLDEAYLDVTDCRMFGGSATLIAQEIRKLIWNELQLTASAGIAPNKFLAKIASDWNKPNGQFVIKPQDIEAFMLELPVKKIYGVGKVTAEKLHQKGIYTCADLQALSLADLKKAFGSRAQEYFDLSRGLDDREVKTHRPRKSLSVEETFSQDMSEWHDIVQFLPSLYEDFIRRLNSKSEYQEKIRGWVVKIKYHDFKQSTHEEVQHSVPQMQDFIKLLEFLRDKNSSPIRLLGIGVRMASDDLVQAEKAQLSFAV